MTRRWGDTVTRRYRCFLLSVVFLPSCQYLQPKTPEPVIQIRVDTVTVTREIAAPLPQGTLTEVCLSTGQTIQIAIASNGDTLVGPTRMRLREAPGITFAGTYAADAGWFSRTDPIQFEKRTYTKAGVQISQKCDDLKIVGDYNGITILAEVLEPAPLARIYVPIRPGIFQPYTTPIAKPRKR